jgi:LuxR family maltose regulon positive regulatory protein
MTQPPESRLPRPSLVEIADRLASVPLALVTAPAGSGKSTLLAAWRRRLAAAQVLTAELDLSTLHSEAALLAGDLVAALGRALPSAGGETRRALGNLSRDDADWRLLLRRLRQDLDTDGRRLCLFLDDFHALDPDSSGARLVSELLRQPLPDLTLVIATRGAAPAALPRLRAAGSLIEVGPHDLNLRSDEIAAIFAERGIGSDEALVMPVLAQTEGWVTGVLLAARALAGHPASDRPAYARRLSRERDLFDYLAAEVLAEEAPGAVAVLEAAALLGSATAGDLRALSREGEAEAIARRAEAQGMLRRTEDGEWVLHPLWSTLLRERLRQRVDAARWAELHREAAGLLERRGARETALEAYAEAGDWVAVATLLGGVGAEWIERGRAPLLRQWIQRLPGRFLEELPDLRVVAALVQARSAPDQSLRELEIAAQQFRAKGDAIRQIHTLGQMGVVALLQGRGDEVRRIVRSMFSLRALLTVPRVRGLLVIALLGLAHVNGNMRRALRLADRAQRYPIGWVERWAVALTRAMFLPPVGDPRLAERHASEALEDPEIARTDFAQASLRLARARARACAGDLDGAREDLRAAEETLADYRIARLRESAAFVRGDVLALSGDLPGAIAAYQECVDANVASGDAPREALGRAHLARAQLAAGDTAVAAATARVALDVERRARARRERAGASTLATALWVMARAGEAEEAWRVAQGLRKRLGDPDVPLAHHTALLALAETARAAGDLASARSLAREGWAFATRHGLTACDPLLGASVSPWTGGEALRQGVAPQYVIARLRAIVPEALPGLLAEQLRDADAAVRERAAAAMGELRARRFHEPLRQAARDRSARVRAAAEQALARLDLRPDYALRVESLGDFRVWRGAVPIDAAEWRGATARRLFQRLLIACGKAVPRDELQEDLWPGAEPDAAANSLRVATSRLNDALEPERPAGAPPHFVVTRGDGLALEIGEDDWDASRWLARLGRLEVAEREGRVAPLEEQRRALDGYRGALLPEVRDEPWVLPLRRELDSRFRRLAQRVGSRVLLRGRVEEALALAERLLASEPADEAAVALAMRAHLAAGERAAALRAYERAREALRAALDLPPGRELEALADQARGAA